MYLSEFLEILFPKSVIQEVIILPRDRVTCIPNAPSYIGLVYHKNHIFFPVDLNIFLNPTVASTGADEYNVVAVKIQNCLLGLTVKK